MQDLGSVLPKGLMKNGEGLANTSKSYWMMNEEERRAYVQKKCDFYNREKGDLNEKDGYECLLCKNKGYISVIRESGLLNGIRDYTQAMAACKCKPVRDAIMRMKRSGLEPVIKRYTFAAYEAQEPWQKAIKEAAQRFTKEEKGVFFIGGNSGCGKTHICTAITAQFLREGRAAYYMLWQEEALKLKQVVTDSPEYGRRMDYLKNVDVLYIDDFFKPIGENASPSPADIRVGYELINHRYNNGDLITIISSEKQINEILDIDEAIGGRLVEYAKGYAFNIAPDRAKNYRLKNVMNF